MGKEVKAVALVPMKVRTTESLAPEGLAKAWVQPGEPLTLSEAEFKARHAKGQVGYAKVAKETAEVEAPPKPGKGGKGK